MSLLKLIGYLSNTEKTKILGEETTRILRFTFTVKDTDTIPAEVIDEAVASKDGVNLIYNNKLRNQLIDSIPSYKIESLGIHTYDEAQDIYQKDINKFIRDFHIESIYKRKEIVDERKSLEYVVPKYGENNGTNAFPHPYQLSLKNQINKILRETQDMSVLVTMPTGSGKTVLAMEVLIDLFRNYRPNDEKRFQVGWLVDSSELSEQSFQSFQKLWKQKGDRIVYAQRYFGRFNSLDLRDSNKITFATFPLLAERLDTSDVRQFLINANVIIVDEAHGANALTYSDVIGKYKKLNPKGKILGLTATPYRNDDNEYQSLKGLFQDYLEITDKDGKRLNSPMEYLIEKEYLAEIDYQVLNAERGESRSEYYNNLHESVKKECIKLIERGENSIIFAESKSHAIAINLYLKTNNIESELIVGETPDGNRKDYLKRFGNKNDNLSILVNYQILSTGIDVPGMNSIMILANVNSPTLALQIIGRAMRGVKNGGNKRNVIYLTKDNFNKLHEYKILEDKVLDN